MKFEEAMKQMIIKYFDGQEPKEYKKAVGGRKHRYTKKYFDDASEEFGLIKDKDNGEEESK